MDDKITPKEQKYGPRHGPRPKRSEATKRKISLALKGKNSWLYGKKFSEETRKKISEARLKRKVLLGYLNSVETRRKMSDSHKGKPSGTSGKLLSEEAKKKMSVAHKGRPLSEETKKKLREAAFEYAKRMVGIVCPRIGKHEKEILDELEKRLGYRILRQFKCGGYFLDGYIPEINLAIEIDEKYHERERTRGKDLKREEFIKQKLGSQFIRIRDY